MLKAVAILGVPGLVKGCGGVPQMTEADRASIDSLRAEHVAGVNGRDADLVLRGMSDNVVYLGPELAPVVGLEALGAIIRPAYEELDPDITMTPQEVTVDRPHAFEWGCLGGVIRSDGNRHRLPYAKRCAGVQTSTTCPLYMEAS